MISDSLLGVIGTLSGTVLGYVLNECSKKGKNKISFENVNIVCSNYNIVNCTLKISMSLNIINSSAEIKNIIKPKIILKKGDKILIDEYVRMYTDKSNYKDYLSCPPKIFTSINLEEIHKTIQIENQSNKLAKMTEWFKDCELLFYYANDCGKLKKVHILKDCLNENEKFKSSLNSMQKKGLEPLTTLFSEKLNSTL